MIDVFWWYAATLIFVGSIAFIFVLYRLWLGDKYIAAANKLKSQMANIRQNFPELEEKKNKLVASALGDIGIEGIMGELGIDPKLLNNPLVKGLIDKYAPKLIERLSSADKSKSQETGLL
jgi:hypothetical protein